MRIALCAVILMACASVGGQAHQAFNLSGRLELVDLPPEATPVEVLGAVRLMRLSEGRGYPVDAQPDRDGRFVLKDVRPGHYSLELSFPGRIRTFSSGSRELAPDGLELTSGDVELLQIIVSLKTSVLSVKARGLPEKRDEVIVLLAPADPYLTFRQSCTFNKLTSPQTIFGYVPPGKYRIFIVDSQFQSDVAAYGPRFPDFLQDQATPVEVSENGQTEVTATYVDRETVTAAIRQAGPLH